MFWRLKKWMREKTGPIRPDVAINMKHNLSIIYAFCTWNALGLIVYLLLKENVPEKPTSADYLKMLGVEQKTQILSFSGFTQTSQDQVQITKEEIEKHHRISNDQKKNGSEE